MKKFFLFFHATIISISLLAQVPQAMNYQAVARDEKGDVLANRLVALKLTILDGTTAVYSERQIATTNQFGLFVVTIGQGGSVLNGTFEYINWGFGSKSLKVEFDPNGGTNYLDFGEEKLLSVPYAFYAAQSGNSAQGLVGEGSWQIGGNIGTDSTNFLGTTDSMSLNFRVNNIKAGRISLTNVSLGFNADVANNLVNATAIGANAKAGASNSLILGSVNGVNGATANTKVGVGTNTPQQALHVKGQMEIDTLLSAAAGDSVVTIGANGVLHKRSAVSLADGNEFQYNSLNKTLHNSTRLDSANFVFGSNLLDDTAGTKDDKRMFFNKAKGAFRAGQVTDLSWNNDSLGLGSFAAGYNVKAEGSYSVAFGYKTIASANHSVSMGNSTIASGLRAVAMGDSTIASGNRALATGQGVVAAGSASLAAGNHTTASGAASLASGYGTKATGGYTVALGDSTLASGNGAVALGGFSTASGGFSLVTGTHTIASGTNAMAVGAYTTASGFASVSTGYGTVASGSNSVTMGNLTTASGNRAVAIGEGTVAASFAEVALGANNTNVSGNTIAWVLSDRIFSIGNGTDSLHRSNALTVLKNGKTAIGNITPQERLHIGGKVRIDTLLSGSASDSVVTVDANGVLRKRNAANYINTDNQILTRSNDTLKISGGNSVLLPTSVFISENGRTHNTMSTDSFAFVNANGKITLGNNANFTTGIGTVASGNYAAALGYNTSALGASSTALGSTTTASGCRSVAAGYQSTASGDQSLALGTNVTALSFGEIAVGANNTDYVPTDTHAWNAGDRIFSIGNGASTGAKSNALTVYKNGKVEVSSADLVVASVGSGVVVKSPDGNCWRITVANNGTLSATSISCP